MRTEREQGWRDAAATLRDDALYKEWNRLWGLDPAGPRSYVPAEHRDVMHDFVEWAADRWLGEQLKQHVDAPAEPTEEAQP